MMEWDLASVKRKFQQTFAYVTSPSISGWMFVNKITDSGEVWVSTHRDDIPTEIGVVLTEMDEIKEGKPLVSFEYRPIICGLYHVLGLRDLFLLCRKHQKNWEIGIGSNGYYATRIFQTGKISTWGIDFTKVPVNFNRPVLEYKTDNVEVFGHSLYRARKTLYSFEEPVALMEDGDVIPKHPAFVPLIKPLLGEAWQIAL